MRRRWSLIGKKSRSHAVVSLLTRTQYLLAQIPDTLSSAFPSYALILYHLLQYKVLSINSETQQYIQIYQYINIYIVSLPSTRIKAKAIILKNSSQILKGPFILFSTQLCMTVTEKIFNYSVTCFFNYIHT